MTVADQPRPLQHAGRLTGASAIHAQHLRRAFLRGI
jgi:hypothetical protein